MSFELTNISTDIEFYKQYGLSRQDDSDLLILYYDDTLILGKLICVVKNDWKIQNTSLM